jgi:predicted ArsR family transcriptional regulator
MPQQTRKQIVHILEQRETASARELSRLLDVTPSNIRHHLSILIEQGSVKIAGYKESRSRGRPSAIFTLIQPTLKDNLDLLSSILLQSISEELSSGSQENKLRWLAQRLCAEFPQPVKNPTQNLYAAIQTLNSLNYHARWEAHVDSPRIMFKHCPYARILEDHPEMCQVDGYLVESLTGVPSRLIAKRTLAPDGNRYCIFRITKK